MIDTNIAPDTNSTPDEPIVLGKTKFRLICASKCKKFAKEFAKVNRPANKFSRVSEEFLISCEVALKNHIQSRIRSHPSNGKTLQ